MNESFIKSLELEELLVENNAKYNLLHEFTLDSTEIGKFLDVLSYKLASN